MTKRAVRGIFATLASAAVVVGVAGCMPSMLGSPSDERPSSASATVESLPSGAQGAADFDAGAIVVGRGSTTVDTFVDPMCPYCGQFERSVGDTLAGLVDDGTITLRVHPLNFLDQASAGTEYSSRASNALTCVAASAPTRTLHYLAALFADQPEEGSAGRTDEQLAALAKNAGASGGSDCIRSGRYIPWIDHVTQTAINGPLPDADIKRITGTPTVLVDGHVYTGPITDGSAVAAFIAAGGES
jgi:protein-disulfide isomerase